jgi:hypothetical protein
MMLEQAEKQCKELEKDPWWINGRFEVNEFNQPVIDAKIEICIIMELILGIRLEMRVYTFFYYWYSFFK